MNILAVLRSWGARNKLPLLADITSRSASRIRSGTCAIAHLRDRAELEALAAHLPEITRRAAELGEEIGSIAQAMCLRFVIRKLVYYRNGAGCLCQLYPEYSVYSPIDEAQAGHVRIEAITHADDSCIEACSCTCTCTSCGTKFRADEREYHHTWWEWALLSDQAAAVPNLKLDTVKAPKKLSS